MPSVPAFPRAADIEASLELMAERCEDPTPFVYERLFAQQPEMRAYFWRDTNDAIKGEMLARTFAAILDFVGERRYAGHMIGTEMITHEGYDIPRDIFATFFAVVGETVQALLAEAWTPEFEIAWRELLAEIATYAAAVPQTGGAISVSDAQRKEMQRRFAAG